MDQATLDNDELFGEAASELQDDIERALSDAEEALPDHEEVWSPEGDNLLGQLNALRGTLDPEEATTSLREAKKWLAVAERSGALEDGDLTERVAAVEAKLEAMAEANEAVSALTSTLPELREALQDE